MKRKMYLALAMLAAACLVCGCISPDSSDDLSDDTETDSSADSDTDTDSDGDSDSDSGSDSDVDSGSEKTYIWPEGQGVLIGNQSEFNWAIKQTNVLVLFVGYENVDSIVMTLSTVMNDNLPWIWLAAVDCVATPVLCESESVSATPLLKFFSYGVEMKELTLAGKATQEQVTVNAQVLLDRYESEVIHPSTFDELVEMLDNLTTPTLVKFGAVWCPGCGYMAPRIALASIEYGEKLVDENGDFIRDKKLFTFIEVDIDEIPELVEMFNIGYIPLLAFYDKEGVMQINHNFVGSMPYETLKSKIDIFIANH